METRICPKCGSENEVAAKFCSECGSSFACIGFERQICPKCGAEGRTGAKYCNRCGHRLEEAEQLQKQRNSFVPDIKLSADNNVTPRHNWKSPRHVSWAFIILIVLGILVAGAVVFIQFLYPDQKDNHAEAKMAIATSSVGDVVTLGHYEQDGKADNGAEPIEWQVLAKDSGKIFMVSSKILDNRAYSIYLGSTWQQSDIRKWLNDDFYNSAFDDWEKELLVTTDLPEEGVSDKVFLLSNEEVLRHFPRDEDRKGVWTPYANKQVYNNPFAWLLRSVSSNPNAASVVFHITGNVSETAGLYNITTMHGIRPAITISVPIVNANEAPVNSTTEWQAETSVSIGEESPTISEGNSLSSEKTFNDEGIFQFTIWEFSTLIDESINGIQTKLGAAASKSEFFVTPEGREIYRCVVGELDGSYISSKGWYTLIHGFDKDGVFTDGMEKQDIVKLYTSVPMSNPTYCAATLVAMIKVCDPTLSLVQARDIVIELTEEVFTDITNVRTENGLCYALSGNPLDSNALVFQVYADGFGWSFN